MKDLDNNSTLKKCNYKSTGFVNYQEYTPKKSKYLIDIIDTIFAIDYKMNECELDFIINYDIKYRMGDSIDD